MKNNTEKATQIVGELSKHLSDRQFTSSMSPSEGNQLAKELLDTMAALSTAQVRY